MKKRLGRINISNALAVQEYRLIRFMKGEKDERFDYSNFKRCSLIFNPRGNRQYNLLQEKDKEVF